MERKSEWFCGVNFFFNLILNQSEKTVIQQTFILLIIAIISVEYYCVPRFMTQFYWSKF